MLSSKKVVEKIASLLEEKFKGEDFSDCFLIEIKLHPNGKLHVFIDSDTGVTFDKCRKISRYLERHIDEKGWLNEKYVLEVSSAGVERPLKLKRQYPKNIGRKVEVKMIGNKTVKGTLIAVNDDCITIEEKVRLKDGKKKKTQIVKTAIPFGEIEKVTVKISF